MVNNNLKLEDMVQFVTINPDSKTHIKLREPNLCVSQCENKPCTYICPSHVYDYDSNNKKMLIEYQRCVECGACIYACPVENINWEYPRPKYGVFYRY